MEEEKNKGGRPTKLSQDIIDTFKDIVDTHILAWTNEEIFDELDYRLKEKGLESISYSTFKNWKNQEKYKETHKEFLTVIKKALRNQKHTILNALLHDDEDKTWQRKAWICERKFSEWNLKSISENKTDVNVTNFPEFIIKKGTDES